MTTDAEAAGYMIAFGQGTPTSNKPYLGWNGGECCLFNDSSTVDDVQFTRQALKIIRSVVAVDESRTYAMGWSNGGFMVERLLCETGSLFAGIAADASAVGILPGGQAGLAYCDAVFGRNYTNYFHIHVSADIRIYTRALLPCAGAATRSPAPFTSVVSRLLGHGRHRCTVDGLCGQLHRLHARRPLRTRRPRTLGTATRLFSHFPSNVQRWHIQ